LARSTAIEILSSAIVSNDPLFRDKLLSTRMIRGGAVSTIAPNAAILSNIVSIVFCRGEHRSTVIICGGAISYHDPIADAPLPISLNSSRQLVENHLTSTLFAVKPFLRAHQLFPTPFFSHNSRNPNRSSKGSGENEAGHEIH
jgi:hypothetical protein